MDLLSIYISTQCIYRFSETTNNNILIMYLLCISKYYLLHYIRYIRSRRVYIILNIMYFQQMFIWYKDTKKSTEN